jgi:hypothetical protein
LKSGTARLLGWSAALLWLLSWLLPVIEGYPGWAAFRAALSGPFRETFPVRGEDAVAQLLSALTNVVFVAQFVQWELGRVARTSLFLKVTLACLLLDLYWLVQAWRAHELRSLLAGYYCWLGGFALLAAAAVISVVSGRRTSKIPTAGTPT